MYFLNSSLFQVKSRNFSNKLEGYLVLCGFMREKRGKIDIHYFSGFLSILN